MNEAEISILVVGITEIAKRFGLTPKLAPVFAIILAAGISVGEAVNIGDFDYYSAVMRGLLIGVATTGTYAALGNFVAKNSAQKHSHVTKTLEKKAEPKKAAAKKTTTKKTTSKKTVKKAPVKKAATKKATAKK
jgi:hypothetical protein